MWRVLSVMVLVAAVLAPGSVRAADAPGCEGLADFRAELFPIGERWADGLSALGTTDPNWDPLTMSSDDWTAYAELSLAINRELKSVQAPTWASEWMDVRVDTTALQEQIGKAVASGGVLLILGFSDSMDSIDQRDTETREAAIAHCPDFAQFAYDWDALDGEVDGTPVATPSTKD